MTPTSMTIQIAEDILTDLQARLARVRWPDEIPGAGWQYGTDLTYLRALVAYWRQQYDWRLQEAQLNTLRHLRSPCPGSPCISFTHWVWGQRPICARISCTSKKMRAYCMR
jgi:hypothetical protein